MDIGGHEHVFHLLRYSRSVPYFIEEIHRNEGGIVLEMERKKEYSQGVYHPCAVHETMKHTFLVKEGLWVVRGFYYNDCDEALTLKGETTVSHYEGLWVREDEMVVTVRGRDVAITHRYTIQPFGVSQGLTTWESFHADIGMLRGVFVVVDDAIISTCMSEVGGYSGSETFVQVDDIRYRSRGVLLQGQKKLSSWSVGMQKIR